MKTPITLARTSTQAALAAGRALTEIEAAIAAGELQAIVIGKRVLIPDENLRAWVDRSLPERPAETPRRAA